MAERLAVAVLGGGLTGLSAARALQRHGLRYRLFEREAVPGGHAVTVEEDGYRFDRTGHLLHLRSPEMQELALSVLPESRYLKLQRRSAVFSHGVYTRYPFQANTFGLPPEVAYECVAGFVQAHFARERPAPKSFEEYCLLHFGPGISKHFMLPYNSRLWGVPASEITSEWCQRFVPLPRLEDVLRGAVGASPPELGYNTRFWYPRGGIGEFAGALAAQASIELQRAPRRVELSTRTLVFDDERVPFELLLSSIPLPALLALLDEVPEPVRRAAARLRSTHLYYFDVALSAPNPRPYHWVYVPEAKYPFYRVGCYSHFSAELAPPGCASLYVELAARELPDPGQAWREVLAGLGELGVLNDAGDVRFARLRRLEHAYVIYDHQYRAALDEIEPFLREKRIISSGRYGGWNYSSMEDALCFGRDAAARAAALLRGQGA